MVCMAFKSVVVETCVDCWAAVLTFRGPPGIEDAVEYMDMRLLAAMVERKREIYPHSRL